MRTDEGVVMAVEKRVTSPLLVRPAASPPLSLPAYCRQSVQPAAWLLCTANMPVACVHGYLLPRPGPTACLPSLPQPRLPPLPAHLPALPARRPQEPTSIEKVAEVDEHIGVAMSGLTADARTLIDHGRVETQQHRFTYNEPMPLESLTQVGQAGASLVEVPACLGTQGDWLLGGWLDGPAAATACRALCASLDCWVGVAEWARQAAWLGSTPPALMLPAAPLAPRPAAEPV